MLEHDFAIGMQDTLVKILNCSSYSEHSEIKTFNPLDIGLNLLPRSPMPIEDDLLLP